MSNKPKYYVDACCFTEAARNLIGKGRSEREIDVLYLKAILQASLDGNAEVFTSTLTIAECLHVDGLLTEEIKSFLKKLLTSGQYVMLIQDTVLVAEKARNLKWVHDIGGLRGADGVHVASALELRCDEFLTFDDKGPVKQKDKIYELGLRVCFPRHTLYLPAEYEVEPPPLLQGIVEEPAEEEPMPEASTASGGLPVDTTEAEEKPLPQAEATTGASVSPPSTLPDTPGVASEKDKDPSLALTRIGPEIVVASEESQEQTKVAAATQDEMDVKPDKEG